jgi:DnaB-like helicase C terminal domain
MLGNVSDPSPATTGPLGCRGHDALDDSPRLADMLVDLVKLTQSRFAAIPNGVTGIAQLDACLSPIEPGSALVIASSKPVDGMTLALQIALRAALANHPVVVASSRHRPELIAHRLLALAAGVDGCHLLHGRLPETAWYQLGRAVRRLASVDIRITHDTTIARLESIASGGRVDDRQRVPLVIVAGACHLLRQSKHGSDARRVRRLVAESARAWVFTTRSGHRGGWHSAGSTPTADESEGVADTIVELTRRGAEVVAEIENGYGWTGEVELHERRCGLGYFGRADYTDADVLGAGGERCSALREEFSGQ